MVWHDVECGSYAADLALWSALAGELDGALLELGAGTGRVALALAAEGLEVTALDASAALVDELRRRARERGLALETVVADARELEHERRFAAIIGPMQFAHLLGGERGRRQLLRGARARLLPAGAIALAVLTEPVPPADAVAEAPLPDVAEIDSWVYSSLPLDVRNRPEGIVVRRLRQIVSPAGELTESVDSIRLDRLDPDRLEAEARTEGLRPRERLEIAATDDHVGSTVCVLEVA